MDLKEKKVFITGGTSGIGLQLAKVLVEKGCRVIVCGRNEEKLLAIEKNCSGIITRHMDLTKECTEDIFRHLMIEFDGIVILVNNAGVQERYQWEDGFYNQAVNELKINYMAGVKMIDVFLQQRDIQKKAIVNITSLLALFPKKSAPTYGASKAAMHVFTKSLRYQLQDTGVKIFEVLPPLVATDMTSIQSQENKLSVTQCVHEIVDGIEKNRYEIRPGKAKKIAIIGRIVPGLVEHIMKSK